MKRSRNCWRKCDALEVQGVMITTLEDSSSERDCGTVVSTKGNYNALLHGRVLISAQRAACLSDFYSSRAAWSCARRTSLLFSEFGTAPSRADQAGAVWNGLRMPS